MPRSALVKQNKTKKANTKSGLSAAMLAFMGSRSMERVSGVTKETWVTVRTMDTFDSAVMVA